MSEFQVSITNTEDKLHVKAVREDGETRETAIPTKLLKLFNASRDLIEFLTGGNDD